MNQPIQSGLSIQIPSHLFWVIARVTVDVAENKHVVCEPLQHLFLKRYCNYTCISQLYQRRKKLQQFET